MSRVATIVVLTTMLAAGPVLWGCREANKEEPRLTREFFGVAAPTTRIAYVLDRTGSMTDSMMYVKYELKRSVRALKPSQEFYVVFYSTAGVVEQPSQGFIHATEANKAAACEFIDSVVPIGQDAPAEGLRKAFALKPDVIYFLTDGEVAEKDAQLIEELNHDRRVVVNTFCFLYPHDEIRMQEIARRNGGTYRYIAEDDLEKLGR